MHWKFIGTNFNTYICDMVINLKNLLPLFTPGEWINTANIDADVFINSTHIVETWHPDVSRWRKAVYVCKEQRDSRYMMARLTIDGCQVDYQCFDFLPRHHNVIRFRKGVAMIMDRHIDDFVCWGLLYPGARQTTMPMPLTSSRL